MFTSLGAFHTYENITKFHRIMFLSRNLLYETETDQIVGLSITGYDTVYNERIINLWDGMAVYIKQSINHQSYIINLINIKILQTYAMHNNIFNLQITISK